jgi:hypothetical protein
MKKISFKNAIIKFQAVELNCDLCSDKIIDEFCYFDRDMLICGNCKVWLNSNDYRFRVIKEIFMEGRFA